MCDTQSPSQNFGLGVLLIRLQQKKIMLDVMSAPPEGNRTQLFDPEYLLPS
jgi:hypothetical protein